MKRKIKYTSQGFSYVDVYLEEILNWGGYGVCTSCNKVLCHEMKLIYVLHDTMCLRCFNEWRERIKKMRKEDIEYDLNIQKQYHIDWYKEHGVL